MLGSAVARTPARRVIVGIAVGRGEAVRGGAVGAAVARATTLALAPAPVRGLGGSEDEGVGEGVLGVIVRTSRVGTGVGSGVGDGLGLFATGGCNGAFGFFGCASA